MNKELASKKLEVPGLREGGIVNCPEGFQKGPCQKGVCERWIVLTYNPGTKDEKRVGRCAKSWDAILKAEQNQLLIKNNEKLSELIQIIKAKK